MLYTLTLSLALANVACALWMLTLYFLDNE